MDCRFYKCRAKATRYIIPYVPLEVVPGLVCDSRAHAYCEYHQAEVNDRYFDKRMVGL